MTDLSGPVCTDSRPAAGERTNRFLSLVSRVSQPLLSPALHEIFPPTLKIFVSAAELVMTGPVPEIYYLLTGGS